MGVDKLRGMQPEAAQSLARAMDEIRSRGIPINLNSGFRSPEQQKALYEKYLAGKNPYHVDPPGQSPHQQGTAADLGIAPAHRDAANAILAKHGWTWNGPSDEVHYDFTAGSGDPHPTKAFALGAAMQQDPLAAAQEKYFGAGPTGQASAAPLAAAQAKYFGAGPTGQASAPSLAPDLMPGLSSTPPPAMPSPGQTNGDLGILGNAAQYWQNWGNSVFGADAGGFGSRATAFVQPVSDAFNSADMLTGGALNYAMRPYSAVRNAAIQFAQQSGGLPAITDPDHTLPAAIAPQFGGLGGMLLRGQGGFSPTGRAAIWNSVKQALAGKQDPTIQGGLISSLFNPGLSQLDQMASSPETTPFEGGLATFASGVLRDVLPVGDIAADWEFGGKYANAVFKPILAGAPAIGGAVSSLRDGAGPFAGVAKAVSPIFDNALVNQGVSGVARAGLEATNKWAWNKWGGTDLGQRILPVLQSFAKTGPDYRAGLDTSIRETAIMRQGDALIDRVLTQIKDYSNKLNAAGKPVIGNALEGSQWDDPALAATGLMQKNLVGQFVTLYKEIGSQGSFLTEPELMRQVITKGLDWDTIKKIGDDAKAIDLLSGQGQVKAGVMTPETFAENAGQYTPRSYQISQLTKTEATGHALNLERQGLDGTDVHALIKNVAENGGAEREGGFASPPGLRDIVHQRELLTPEQRLSRIPDLDYTHSAQAIRGQFQEIAKVNLMNAVADPTLGISLANEFGSARIKQQGVTSQPRFQGELLRGQKSEAAIKNSFEKAGGHNDTQDLLASRLDRSIANAKEIQAALANHVASEPQEPAMPGGHPYKATDTAGPLETAEQRVARRHAESGAGQSLEGARQVLDQKSLDQYAGDLNTWQRQRGTWQNKLSDLAKRSEAAVSAVDDARQAHDAHLEMAQQRLGELDKQRLRNQLLSGERPANYGDASDALHKALDKLDPSGQKTASMTPEVQDELNRSWLEHWNKYNDDIWHDIPPTGLPHVPAGLDPKAIEAMGGNNPLVAMALNDKLSFPDRAIDAQTAARLGLTRWGSGKGEYGAMDGRWAPIALKNFIDDAMDPHRFTGDAKGATAGMSKWLGEMIRTGKLYMNPISTMNVFVQSLFDNMATAYNAGKEYNPLSDSQGRAEMHAWAHGGPITPRIQAMLDFGNEMAGGQRHGVDPFLQSAKDPLGSVGQTAPVKAFRALKGVMRDKFVSEQLLPKAGLVKVLMDQGMSGPEAAMWAEKAHGGAGADMGGVETPGMMKLAENLNRQGVAMFTSYPLHSISRIMEMMVTRPDLVMRWPLLRNYMIQNSSQEARDQANQHNIEYSEAPIPTNSPVGRLFANPNGSEGTINLSNAIPYGGAFGGLGFPNIANPFMREAEAGDRAEKSGLNPADTRAEKADAFTKSVLPGSIYAMWKVYAASQGRTPTPGATMAQTVPQSLTAFSGLPMRHPETGMSREFGPQKGFTIPSRLRTMMELDARYYAGYTHGERDFTDDYKLRNMEPEDLEHTRMAAVKELDRISKDKNISEADATRMLRNQAGYIHSIMALATRQGARLYDYSKTAMQQGAQQ